MKVIIHHWYPLSNDPKDLHPPIKGMADMSAEEIVSLAERYDVMLFKRDSEDALYVSLDKKKKRFRQR